LDIGATEEEEEEEEEDDLYETLHETDVNGIRM
jgi:hypothetical protein